MIYTTFPPNEAAEAEKDCREECAPFDAASTGMPRQKLLRNDATPGEYVAYSEWADRASIDAYLKSADHEEIKRRTSGMPGRRSS